MLVSPLSILEISVCIYNYTCRLQEVHSGWCACCLPVIKLNHQLTVGCYALLGMVTLPNHLSEKWMQSTADDETYSGHVPSNCIWRLSVCSQSTRWKLMHTTVTRLQPWPHSWNEMQVITMRNGYYSPGSHASWKVLDSPPSRKKKFQDLEVRKMNLVLESPGINVVQLNQQIQIQQLFLLRPLQSDRWRITEVS